jgi:hypothetical protein
MRILFFFSHRIIIIVYPKDYISTPEPFFLQLLWTVLRSGGFIGRFRKIAQGYW